MKAYVVESAGGPFRVVEMPTPRPASGHVLVKICASEINSLDTKIRAGQAGHAKQPLRQYSAWTWRAWLFRSAPM